MSISRYFSETLGTALKNPRWSWGAVRGKKVFLRVWDDEISKNDEEVVILRHEGGTSSAGYGERLEQIALLEQGSEGYGVICTAVDTSTAGRRRIRKFNKAELLPLGPISDDGECKYARILSRVPVTGAIAE